MTTPQSPTPRGLRIHDLIGLVVGYGMAALLARSFWPRSASMVGIPAIAMVLEFLWLGLAMSGPILLLLDNRGLATPKALPRRPGRPISEVPPTDRSVGRGPTPPATVEPARYTRAELAWLLIGGYWIALTLFVVPGRQMDTPWALACLLQLVAALGLLIVVPKKTRAGVGSPRWTHPAALGLLYTWPVAWIFLIVLSRGY